ncbi:hypothetical protein [Rhodanobacter sp. A1T4]|uniref:hypothetical protein n=1 Tax=Rhodanobacter sp. A1T4 TaxID=2723087 RepID=UPI001620DCDF|nr:hypothetical protein [Rhodanobacter sp. A1T4]MBB6247818.1 hypothetical protein [Rhodanobacter sp. A1T4]
MSNHRSSHGRLTRAAVFFALVFTGFTSVAVAGSGSGATLSAAATAPSESAGSTGTYTYQTLDYPGSSLTILWGINDFGDLGGQYSIDGGTSHAMVYHHGQFEPLDPKGVLGKYFSAAGGSNDLGATYGGYADASELQHGFLIQGRHLETIDFPGHLNSNVDQMNLFGAIAGVYWDADGIYHGVLRRGKGFDTPINVAGARDTYPLGINDNGEIVGYWDGNSVQRHGFYRSMSAQLSTIDVPGALSTVTLEINNRGQIAGNYEDASGLIHGFVDTQGKFVNVDVPGAAGTVATAINNFGVVAGEYFDAAGKQHGFIASPVGTQHRN